MRRAIICGGAIAAAALTPVALATGTSGDARIAGRVLVCNSPGHCMTREFHVSAIDSAGQTVARATTTGSHNRYRLRVAPGRYRLVAKSSGLVCKASATAVAHTSTRQDITCLVP
jgi:hypothetical protein